MPIGERGGARLCDPREANEAQCFHRRLVNAALLGAVPRRAQHCVEEAGALCLRGEVDEIRHLHGAEDDRAIGHDQSERWFHDGYLPV